MRQNIYYFNPKTLSFEKKTFSWKEILKRILWFLSTAFAFSIVIVWILFYIIDSPKELILRQENEKLKAEMAKLDQRYDQLATVATDMQERDDNIYRAIFEADPIPMSVRYPFLPKKHTSSSQGTTNADVSIEQIRNKADRLQLALTAQSLSYDTVANLIRNKKDMLAAIPAIRPLPDVYEITSGFGYRFHPILKVLRPHTGIDISAATGTPVYATADGVVSRETPGGGYGNVIVINHGYSYQTLYAHLSKKEVKPGEKVTRGQVIGYVGNTGLSLGSHLHYEVIKDGTKVNPIHYFFGDQEMTPEVYDAILKSSQKVNQSLS